MRKLTLAIIALGAPCLAVAGEPKDLPKGPLGDAVRSGYDMIVNTQTNAKVKPFVGNALNCASCHRDGGTSDTPGNLLTTATKFPSYSAREDTVLTLEDRIDNCFMRSMNGTRPSPDSEVTVDMAAYIAWLARGKPIYGVQNSESQPAQAAKPAVASDFTVMLKSANHANYARGSALYAAQCAACHGADGQGVPGTFPPLWGNGSYNAGAGLANVVKLATWVKGNMPLGNAHLSAQEAFDVALFADAQPRPDFVLAQHLPQGMKADDYNAKVRTETDSVESNLKKVGLSLEKLRQE